MKRIFGCQENMSPSFISNISTDYFSEEEKEKEIKTDDKKENKRAIKKTKNNIEALVEMMGNVSQSKVKISEQKLKIEQEKMERDHKFQMEKLEVKKKNGSMSENNQECYMK
jgi:hypothetical protein